MADTPSYSNFLHCIYDEPEQKGIIGRGCHYSVFRVPEWLDVTGRRVDHALVHDFAVIWDEDHDTRVIEAIERIYLAGLLFPVQFIGERKGDLTVILAAKFWWSGSDVDLDAYDLDAYRAKISEITSSELSMDSWPSDFGMFDKSLVHGRPHQTEYESLIADDGQKVDTYIRNINNLWRIGTWPYRPSFEIS